MPYVHEISAAWRGAPRGKSVAADDLAVAPDPDPRARHFWVPLGLSVMLGLALGATIAAGQARQDRALLEALMASVEAQP